eukprot:3932700-Rhodomonas_salina.2
MHNIPTRSSTLLGRFWVKGRGSRVEGRGSRVEGRGPRYLPDPPPPSALLFPAHLQAHAPS